MGPKKYRPCPNACVEDACKVLGRGFNLKWAVGATKGVMDNDVTAYIRSTNQDDTDGTSSIVLPCPSS